MTILAITQARTGSERLPNKVLKEIHGTPLLALHIKRVLCSEEIDRLIVATTTQGADDPINDLCEQLGVACFRGSESNVLDRYYQAALSYRPDRIVRLTADCPLMDADVVDTVIAKAREEDVDYCSNTISADYPDGEDVEVVKFWALAEAWRKAELRSDREHVTPYIRKHAWFSGGTAFSSYDCRNPEPGYANVRMTVDTQNDFEVIRMLVEARGENCGWKDYADHYLASPEIHNLNIGADRNEGYRRSLAKD